MQFAQEAFGKNIIPYHPGHANRSTGAAEHRRCAGLICAFASWKDAEAAPLERFARSGNPGNRLDQINVQAAEDKNLFHWASITQRNPSVPARS